MVAIIFLSTVFRSRQIVASAKEWSSIYWGKGYEYRKENPDGKNVGKPGILQVSIQSIFIRIVNDSYNKYKGDRDIL